MILGFVPAISKFLFLAILVIYFIFVIKDKKKNIGNIKVPFESIIVLLLNVIGLLTFIMPWVNLPLNGSINAIQLSEKFDDVIFIIIVLSLIYLMFIIGSIIQISEKIIKKSLLTNILEILIPLIISFSAYMMIGEIKTHFEYQSDNIFSEIISNSISIGFGIYVIIAIGILQALICGIMNEKPVFKSSDTEINSENKLKVIDQDKFDEIRKFKQLLDEGIISQEEFEEKKKHLMI